jgi:hypothetical protein
MKTLQLGLLALFTGGDGVKPVFEESPIVVLNFDG